MLWFKFARYVVVMCGIFALAGCGFRPLYSQPAATGEAGTFNVQADLATIHILPIKDRTGQQLRNLLLTRLNPGGEPTQPVYNLRITLTDLVQQLGVQKNSLATRANLRVVATYALAFASSTATGDAADLPSGQILAISSYDISTFEFTTLTARKDALKRAVREISDDMRTRFAVYFAQRRK